MKASLTGMVMPIIPLIAMKMADATVALPQITNHKYNKFATNPVLVNGGKNGDGNGD